MSKRALGNAISDLASPQNTPKEHQPMKKDEAIHVSQAMQKYGGGFISYLGDLITRADEINQQKIKDIWNDEWVRYEEIYNTQMRGKK